MNPGIEIQAGKNSSLHPGQVIMAKLMGAAIFLAAFLCVSCGNESSSSLTTGPSIDSQTKAVGSGLNKYSNNGGHESGNVISGSTNVGTGETEVTVTGQ